MLWKHCATTLFPLLVLCTCCDNSHSASGSARNRKAPTWLVGEWALDKDKVREAILAHEPAEKKPLSSEGMAYLQELLENTRCQYQFYSNGEAQIDYFMTEESHGTEVGRWLIDNNRVVISTTVVQGTRPGAVGERILERDGPDLVWHQPGGESWYLKKVVVEQKTTKGLLQDAQSIVLDSSKQIEQLDADRSKPKESPDIGLLDALRKRAYALRDLTRLDEALEDLDRAIILCESVEGSGNEGAFLACARCRHARGDVRKRMRKYNDAISDHDVAAEIYVRLARKDDSRQILASQAANLTDRACALIDAGKPEKAVDDLRKAVELFIGIRAREGASLHTRDLARADINLGFALRRLGRLPASVRTFGNAAQLHRELVDLRGRSDLRQSLARSLHGRALSLAMLERYEEAIEGFIEAEPLYTELARIDGTKGTQESLRKCRENLARARKFLGPNGALSESEREERLMRLYADLIGYDSDKAADAEFALKRMGSAATLVVASLLDPAHDAMTRSMDIITKLPGKILDTPFGKNSVIQPLERRRYDSVEDWYVWGGRVYGSCVRILAQSGDEVAYQILLDAKRRHGLPDFLRRELAQAIEILEGRR